MLIHNAELSFGAAIADVRIEGSAIAAIAPALVPYDGEAVIDARGCALLPGLHDHHLHLIALAAALDSLQCGPPAVNNAAALERALNECAERKRAQGAKAWIRGIGYHDAVAGSIDRDWLDRIVPDIPVRIQHRSGRLWILNSRALALVGVDASETMPFETVGGRITGRLYDADPWLRARLGGVLPDLRRASLLLASFGVTGITEVTPHNSLATRELLAAAQARGDVLQDICLMGTAELDTMVDTPRIIRGARKIHLHESELPDFDALCADIRISHGHGRPVAIHCVTLAELVFSLGALENAGAIDGDRIEHAGVASPDAVALMHRLGVTVVTQPNFIRERGDNYRQEVESQEQPWLYRARGFLDAGIPLAAGTDAPFGDPDPWLALQAAVDRRTRGGAVIGADEALTPERAIALLTTTPLAPGGKVRCVETGTPADLCLLDRSWREARNNFASVKVQTTIKDGAVIFSRDQVVLY